jgi:hypothetical protein
LTTYAKSLPQYELTVGYDGVANNGASSDPDYQRNRGFFDLPAHAREAPAPHPF